MRKTILILAAAAAALTSTIGMAQSAERRFDYDGQTYVYTASDLGNGRSVIQGHRFPSGNAFRLTVRGDRVSGVSNGVPVSFKLATAKGASGIETASR